MIKILFVCTGNICRSPTAEGIMLKLVKEAGLEKEIMIDSAGTSSYHQGDAPDLRSIDCALKHGVDLRDLRARQFHIADFAEFDHILVMDEANLMSLDSRKPCVDASYEHAKVSKLLEYAPEYGKDVPDPYYNDGFDRVFKMIETACKNFLTSLKI